MAGEGLLAHGRIVKLEKELGKFGLQPNGQALAAQFEAPALSRALVAKGVITLDELNDALLPLIADHLDDVLARAKRSQVVLSRFPYPKDRRVS